MPLIIDALALVIAAASPAPAAITGDVANQACCEAHTRVPENQTIRPIKPLCLTAHEPRVPFVAPPIHELTAEQMEDVIANRGEPTATIRPSNQSQSGLVIQFNVFGPTNPDTTNALQLTADYYASLFAGDTEIRINVYFSQFSFGGTAPAFIRTTYPEVRDALLARVDADDTIQFHLPENAIPYRAEPGGPILHEQSMTITTANAKALGLFTSQTLPDADMFVGSLPDGYPDDGIGNSPSTGHYSEFSLVDILVHEVGHALGFASVVDLGIPGIGTIDLFRFARTGPDNPESESEFTHFPRAFYFALEGEPNAHNFDIVAREHAASNGSSYQASHFDELGAHPFRVGVMDPAFTQFETGFPHYYSQADLDVFDAIGWNAVGLLPPLPCNVSDTAEPHGVIDLNDIATFLDAFTMGDASADLAGDDGILDLFDIVAFVTAFQAGCQ